MIFLQTIRDLDKLTPPDWNQHRRHDYTINLRSAFKSMTVLTPVYGAYEQRRANEYLEFLERLAPTREPTDAAIALLEAYRRMTT